MMHAGMRLVTTTLAIVLAVSPALAAEPRPVLEAIGIDSMHLTSAFWIARLEAPDDVLMDPRAIAAQNAELMRLDPSMHALETLPSVLTRDEVAAWITDLADAPSDTLYGVDGRPVPAAEIDAAVANRNLSAIPGRQETRYGLVVHRAALRTFPTPLRVFRSAGGRDIDRFQESALFPGMPVVIAHESLDERWWFIVSPRYAAWIRKEHVAEGARQDVFAYGEREPYRIVTGATVRTVFTPEQPALSRLQFDMGVRLPLLSDWPEGRAVNGQHPYTGHIIELPLRTDDGGLRFAPALVQRNADTDGEYLPLTRANIIRQGFKFLGERYGWGHSYGARDCSGFVSEVYRSMGVQIPRNTSDQGVSPALDKRLFDESDTRAERIAALRSLDVGHLVYIPGHVMMVVGEIGGEPWVIHDTTGFGWVTPEGEMARVPLNGVSVTPLLPLASSETALYIDRMTSIVRPAPATE